MDIKELDEGQRKFFDQIRLNVRSYPQEYYEAEKWLKEYYSETTCQIPDACECLIKCLIEKYKRQWQRSVLSEDVRHILLITWWLYDANAELDFVKWPWHSQGRGISRRYAGLLWLNDKGWMELVRAAWTEAEIEQKEAEQPTEASSAKAVMLAEKQLKILKYLKEIKTAVAQVDIEVGTQLSKNTISKELIILKEYDFVAPPKGKKRHVAITQKGIDYLSSLK